MKKPNALLSNFVLITFILATQAACPGSSSSPAVEGGHGGHWSYSGATGPEHWADLDPAYQTCGTGTKQSPIDFAGKIYGMNNEMAYSYKPSAGKVINNGHSIMFTPDDGGYITIGGKRFNLAQIHFHSPSEHKVNSQQFSMEAHFVHKASDGALAVVGQFYESGAANDLVGSIWAVASDVENKETLLTAKLDPSDLLHYNKSYYSYEGSLTTPPCTEGLLWSVLAGVMTASPEQIKKLSDLFGPTARPTQPLNGRYPNYSNVN